MAEKTNLQFWDHHRTVGILLLLLMLSTIPLFLWAISQSTSPVTQAYYPRHCETPKIPRTKVCSTKWALERNEKGCRVFVCEDKSK
jgi:hypothetical protein